MTDEYFYVALWPDGSADITGLYEFVSVATLLRHGGTVTVSRHTREEAERLAKGGAERMLRDGDAALCEILSRHTRDEAERMAEGEITPEREVLSRLLVLKREKDEYGPSETYEREKARAWADAERLLGFAPLQQEEGERK